MATNPRDPLKKPKGWRKIVVDDVLYWWNCHSAPFIKRVSDGFAINTWNHLVDKGWYSGLDSGDIKFTPKLVSEIIRELPWPEIKKKNPSKKNHNIRKHNDYH